MARHVGEYSLVFGGTDRHIGEHSLTGDTVRQLKKYSLKSQGASLGRSENTPKHGSEQL